MYGHDEYIDTYGGFNPSCVPLSAPAYGLLQFDVSSLPANATITGVRFQITSFAGYAQNGDGVHHIIDLGDQDFSEDTTNWNNRPSDGTVAPGNPTLSAGGGDIRTSANSLGDSFVFRNTCSSLSADQDKNFPALGGDQLDNAVKFATAEQHFTAVGPGGAGPREQELTVEIYNPNFAGGGNTRTGRGTSQRGERRGRPRTSSSRIRPGASCKRYRRAPGSTLVRAHACRARPIRRMTSTSSEDRTAPPSASRGSTTFSAPSSAPSVGSRLRDRVVTSAPATSACTSRALTGNLRTPRKRRDCCHVSRPVRTTTPGTPRSISPRTTRRRDRGRQRQRHHRHRRTARWYKFDVVPGSAVKVTLSDLPADYDLALFTRHRADVLAPSRRSTI